MKMFIPGPLEITPKVPLPMNPVMSSSKGGAAYYFQDMGYE